MIHWLLAALVSLIPDGAFVATDGARFTVGGKPFAFVGANLAVMHGQLDRQKAEETIAAARADGLTVGRIWALGEGAADAGQWSRAHELFRAGPDGWLEPAFAQLDRVLVAARARGLRLIVVVSNHWSDYGGVPMYLRWAGLPSSGWGARDRFYSDEKIRALFRNHLDHLLSRTNSLSGVRYVDDPTILGWELMNESRVQTPEGALQRRAFVTEMARFIKQRDPHHLVSSGGSIYTGRAERAEWLALCKLPEIDYCDGHLYPQSTDEVDDRARLDAYIDDRAQLAEHVAHKPIVFGEFGFRTDAREDWLGAPRAAWFERFLSRAFLDGAAGALAWIYQPWGGRAREFGIYVDRRDTDDVRAVLRGWARRAGSAPTAHNPLLGDSHGDALLYDPYHLAHRDPVEWRVANGELSEIPPQNFAAGRFERVGSWDGGPLMQTYGAGDGWFEWRFHSGRAAAVTVVLRVSSEYPGSSAPPDGDSHLVISIDGKNPLPLDVIPDDGAGRVERVRLGALESGAHTLKLEVPAGPKAHGVCIYGEPTGHGAPPVGEATPIQLRFTAVENR